MLCGRNIRDRLYYLREPMLLQGILSLALFLLPAPSLAAAGRQVHFADEAPSKLATTWFDLLYEVVKAEKTPPPLASRVYGIAAVALYESVVSGSKEQRSLAGQLNGLSSVPRPSDAIYDWPAVVNAALPNSIRGVFSYISPNTLGRINSLERKLDGELRGRLAADIYERSSAHGRAVSGAILAWAATDGFALHNDCPYVMPAGSTGGWRPTPPGFGGKPLQPCWGQLRPMALKSGQECAAPGAPKFSDSTNSEFYAAGVEVHKIGLGLSTEQRIIADYWADNAGDSGTPPGHWIAIASQIARKDNLSLVKAAEAYARVGIAVHDAFIGCWYTKYLHNLKRPVTYINDNVHGQWRSYIATPPFPSYPSGHAVQSGAAAKVLTDMFGARGFTDTTHTDHGLKPALRPRAFKSFQQAAAEAAQSRLYGGIHYAFDNSDGLASGDCIGRAVLDRVKFGRGGM